MNAQARAAADRRSKRAAKVAAGRDAWKLICDAYFAPIPNTPMGMVGAYSDLRHAMNQVLAHHTAAIPVEVRARIMEQSAERKAPHVPPPGPDHIIRKS